MLPPDCEVSFTSHGAGGASRADFSDPMFESARKALSDEWQIPAAYVGCGGSIPIAGHFQEILGIEPMLIGFGKDDDALHSPNEKYDMESFHKGIRSWARILDALT
jgi:acetylornithine deacetylase/succinyl-diaminopimelate desuccinylase-like protein